MLLCQHCHFKNQSSSNSRCCVFECSAVLEPGRLLSVTSLILQRISCSFWSDSSQREEHCLCTDWLWPGVSAICSEIRGAGTTDPCWFVGDGKRDVPSGQQAQLLETKHNQINACKGGSYNILSCLLSSLSSDTGGVRADFCHMAVLGAGSSFEGRRPRSCFPKEKEIMCAWAHLNRESAHAVTTYFNKPSSHSEREACPSVRGAFALVFSLLP